MTARLLDWLRSIRPARFPEDGWTVTGIYNGLAHYHNGHIHRVAPAWWHLDIVGTHGGEPADPRPNHCPKCDHHDEGIGWFADGIAKATPDLHVRRD